MKPAQMPMAKIGQQSQRHQQGAHYCQMQALRRDHFRNHCTDDSAEGRNDHQRPDDRPRPVSRRMSTSAIGGTAQE
jgi:hypothetical protein